MLLILLAVLAVALYGAKWTGKGIRPDYLSIQSTRAVKGIFVMLVFLRHYKTCVSLTDALDRPFIKVNNWLAVSLLLRLRRICVLSEKGEGLRPDHAPKAGPDDACPL